MQTVHPNACLTTDACYFSPKPVHLSYATTWSSLVICKLEILNMKKSCCLLANFLLRDEHESKKFFKPNVCNMNLHDAKNENLIFTLICHDLFALRC